MSWANEGKSDNGELKKPGLLPAGDKAADIIELLAAMYRAMQNPEDETNDEDRSEHANQ